MKASTGSDGETGPPGSKRVLNPAERIAEILFGLIMVLTFTGTLGAAEAGREDVRAMLIGALGCNLAWGIIDGVLYVMGSLAERGRNRQTYLAVRSATDAGVARSLIADELPPLVKSVLQPAELDSIRERLMRLPEPQGVVRANLQELKGAIAVFVIVFLSTFPVAVPFVFMSDPATALRASNAVAVIMLFILGYAYGRYAGRSPWWMGMVMVTLGLLLASITIALGG